MPPEVEEMLSYRSQICCFLAQKTHHGFCFVFVVVPIKFFFFFFLGSNCSSRGNPRYRGKGYCLIYIQHTLVSFHVDQLVSRTCSTHGSLDNSVWRANEGVHRAVGGQARVHVQQAAPLRVGDGIGNGLDYLITRRRKPWRFMTYILFVRQYNTATVALWLRRPPHEREVVGSIPGHVIPKTLKLAF